MCSFGTRAAQMEVLTIVTLACVLVACGWRARDAVRSFGDGAMRRPLAVALVALVAWSVGQLTLVGGGASAWLMALAASVVPAAIVWEGRFGGRPWRIVSAGRRR